ncbi:MAG: M28 family peptidase [Candidatus Eisenbacteria bacterium]|nr:M28 family peptidase [Candidatus Eisenbacteria bacterium]
MRPARWVSALAALVLPLAGAACASRLEVNGERALARIQRQVDAGPRIPGTGAHQTIGDWIVSECARLGGRMERQCWTDSALGRPLALCNFIARFGPQGGRRIALLAHWDSRPFSDQDPEPSHRSDPVPGANDGASGVAVLLEVAEAMKREAPPIGVDLVFLDGEDQGQSSRPQEFCLGARHYAHGLALDGTGRPAAAFLFDMVGDRDLGIWPEQQSAERAANLVAIVLDGAHATGARAFHQLAKYALTDDHVPLLEVGIPAVDIIDFDYPAWHTHLDRPDRVSAVSLAEVSRVAAWIVYRSPLSRP